MSIERTVSSHYSDGGLAAKILAGIAEVADDPADLTLEDLAPVDEFHIGGRRATARFTDRLDLRAGARVLDIGSGIGGPARYVAAYHDCHVTGIDLTPEYCEVAELLSQKVGLAERVSFRQGSALALPFDTASFEAAYMVHVGMNIGDKAALFGEVRRVLEPGAVFGIYDILSGPRANGLAYPVPWAATPASNFLAAPEELRELLSGAGFEVVEATDRTAFALEFFEQLGRQAEGGLPALGLHIVMGEDFSLKVANMRQNVEAGRCGPWEFVCRCR